LVNSDSRRRHGVISIQVGGGARMRLQAPYVHRAPKVAMWRVGSSRRLWEWPVTCYYQASPQLMTQQY